MVMLMSNVTPCSTLHGTQNLMSFDVSCDREMYISINWNVKT